MKNEIVIDGVTYIKKEIVTNEIELHSLVNYKGYEWYVIKIKEDEVTLMMKDILDEITYSGENSNDWGCSNIRDYLEDWLDKWLTENDIEIDDLIVMETNYDEDKISKDCIRIPTLREIESLPMEIRDCDSCYWTMTSSYGVSEDCSIAIVFSVHADGQLNYNSVYGAGGVRPVINLKTVRLLNCQKY